MGLLHPESFQLKLKGFGAFAPRVIYIDVPANSELRGLQKGLTKFVAQWGLTQPNHKNRGFVPHVTIAFRDLRRSLFEDAWSRFKDREFNADTNIRHAYLLKHNGTHWQKFIKYEFDQAVPDNQGI